jgi:preprotein translocase subunit SecB
LMLDPMDFGALYATQRVERTGGQPS